MVDVASPLRTKDTTWRSLLAHAATVYDDAGGVLPRAAAAAASGGFASGAAWMRFAMEQLRGERIDPPRSYSRYNSLGIAKYSFAVIAASLPILVSWETGRWEIAVLCLPLFYAVEVQWVFLFPVALDGSQRPFGDSRRLTRECGGTLRAMMIVMPIAATMLLGGFAGRGFVRSWCLGCLAVCIWYEQVRKRVSTVGA